VVRKCVLAIEHDWRLRRLIQANLEPFGLEVRLAVNARHGLELLRMGRPDLILLDADLPDMEAGRWLDFLQAQLAGQVPVIVVSAEPLGSDLGQKGWAIGYLRKPFAVPDLLDRVHQAMDGMAADKENTASLG
jgi:DNA-binding response OmpR family regulator